MHGHMDVKFVSIKLLVYLGCFVDGDHISDAD
jgi:hypothetical protein